MNYNVSAADLPAFFKQMETARLQRVQDGLFESAQAGVAIVAKAAPVDMGEARRSVHAERTGQAASRILVDAPHAGLVELGSRPHWAPLAPLVAWVRRHRASFAASVKRRVTLRKQTNKNLALGGRHLKAAYKALGRRRKYGFGLSKEEVFQAHVDRARSLRAYNRSLRRQYRWRY